MKPILLFFNRARSRVKRITREFGLFFKSSRFYFFPSPNNLMLSLWYGFVHARDIDADATADSYLNDQLIHMDEELEDPELPRTKKWLYRRFLLAAGDPSFYRSLIGFLETQRFSAEMSVDLMRRIKKVRWPGLPGTQPEKTVADVPVGTGKRVRKTEFNAKTYFIAAEIHHELKHQEHVFRSLAKRMNMLAEFVKQQFKADHLPTTFYDLRDYSYKPVLLGKNMSRKGQLKTCFRQIMENPGVFGTAVARHAKDILQKEFE
jgi:hypothetical protein